MNVNKGAAFAALIINLLILLMQIFATRADYKEGGLWMFQYYTVISNVLTGISSGVYLLAALINRSSFWRTATFLRYLGTCMLVLTFLVVIFVLVPLDLKAGINPAHYYAGATSFIHHAIAPVLSFVSFVFLEANEGLMFSHTGTVMCITLLYSAIILFLNIRRVITGPYPFFHVYEQSVMASVIWFVVIGAFAYLLDYLVYILGRR